MTRYLPAKLQAGHGCFRWLLLVPAAEGTRRMPRTRPVGWALSEAPGRRGAAAMAPESPTADAAFPSQCR